MRKETYYLNTRYAAHYDARSKTYTFELSEPVTNAISMKLKQFHLNIQDISGVLLSEAYSVNGYSTHKIDVMANSESNLKTPKTTRTINTESKTFELSTLTYLTADNRMTLTESVNDTIVFNNTNNDITKALGFVNRSYSVDSSTKITSDKPLAVSYLYNQEKYRQTYMQDNKISSSDNIVASSHVSSIDNIRYYDDINHFFLSVNDFCSNLNSNKINVVNNNISDYILDKVERTNDTNLVIGHLGPIDNSTKENYIYTMIPNNGNTRYYNQPSDIKTLKVKLLHETGTPLNLIYTDFNFTLEFEIES